ncbi:MAG: hypothetical protein KDD04_09605, partial [Sinomicrobium sp.]|nr:hypothetical protein [Sinomicrobium sp.]
MKVSVQKFLENAGVEDAFYPGKRIVKPYKQPGSFKSHCAVLDWRDPGKVRIDIKAGLTGKKMEPKELKDYPVC